MKKAPVDAPVVNRETWKDPVRNTVGDTRLKGPWNRVNRKAFSIKLVFGFRSGGRAVSFENGRAANAASVPQGRVRGAPGPADVADTVPSIGDTIGTAFTAPNVFPFAPL